LISDPSTSNFCDARLFADSLSLTLANNRQWSLS
jgi:hypothetical protein